MFNDKKCKLICSIIAIILVITQSIYAQTFNGNTAIIEENINKYKMGLKLLGEEEYELIPKSDLIEVFNDVKINTALQIDLSDNFPKAGNQGSQNSCVGWAVGYANKTYQEKIENDWFLNTNDHIFSPSYIYNQINFGNDYGAYIDYAMQLIVDEGVCPISNMPYDEKDYLIQPNGEQKRIASYFKAEKWEALERGDIDTMKAHLTKGQAIVIAIPVFGDFMGINIENRVWDNLENGFYGYHAVCVVGYDDSMQAFKFINSWGTEWGLDGYGWISYDMMQSYCFEAYVMTDIVTSANINSYNVLVQTSDYKIGNNILNKWEEGFTGELYITNSGVDDINNWKLEFDCEEDIKTFWEADIVSHEGNHYVVEGKDWSEIIIRGNTLKLGFIASLDGDANISKPKNIVLSYE